MCVQNFDDSLNSAIRMTYRSSQRSSSMCEPRHPLLKVVLCLFDSFVCMETNILANICSKQVNYSADVGNESHYGWGFNSTNTKKEDWGLKSINKKIVQGLRFKVNPSIIIEINDPIYWILDTHSCTHNQRIMNKSIIHSLQPQQWECLLIISPIGWFNFIKGSK